MKDYIGEPKFINLLDRCICPLTDKRSRWAKIVLLSNLFYNSDDILTAMSLGYGLLYGACSKTNYEYGIFCSCQAENVLGICLDKIDTNDESISLLLTILSEYVDYYNDNKNM